MAYTLDQYVFRGLSTDTKPTVDPAGRGALLTGARFVEINTGNVFDWNGSAWVPALYAEIVRPKTLAVTGTGAALNDTPVAATEVGEYRSVSIHVLTTFVGTLVFEASNDNASWSQVGLLVATGGINSSGVAVTGVISPSANSMYYGQPIGRYFRVRISAYTSGTVSLSAWFSSNHLVMHTLGVTTTLPNAAAWADTASRVATVPAVECLNSLDNGSSRDRQRTPSIFVDVGAVTVTTIATVWTPASGKKFRLMGGTISASAAMSVLLEDNAAGASNFVFRTPKLEVDKPYNLPLLGNGRLSAAANNVLKATGSVAGAITGTLFGTEE